MGEVLIQEEYLGDEWKLCVVCILLNQTHNSQVRPLLGDLFDLIPDASSAAKSNPETIAKIIRPVGFQNMKAKRIIEMSQKWISGFNSVDELPGIGKYGKESWRIFVEEDYDFEPSDKKLKLFLVSGGPERVKNWFSEAANS
jgi:endonuclease III